MDAYISSDPNDPNPSDVGQSDQGGTAPVPSTDIQTAPLVADSTSTQAAPPPSTMPDVLGSMFGDHKFQSASPLMQRTAVDEAASKLDPDYQALSADDKSAYVSEILKNVPAPDPLYYKRMISKVYTPLLTTAGGIGASVATDGASNIMAPFIGTTVGVGAAHYIDRQLGISKPLSSTGGMGGELIRDNLEGAANTAIGTVLGPILGGMELSPEGESLLESSHNLGVDLPPEALAADNPLIGSIGQALRVLPGARQVVTGFDSKMTQQLIKAHTSILENGDVNTNLEDYGNAIQKQLDDFVRTNTDMNTAEALKFKNAILSQHGSPLSYDELGQNMQDQAQSYFEGMGKTADALYEHAKNSFDPNFAAKLGSSQEMAHNMRLQALESAPQFQNSQTNSLLKDLSGQTEVEAMVAQRNAEIDVAQKSFADQGINPNTPAVQAMIPKPISQAEIQAYMDNRTMPLSKLMRLKSDLGNSIRSIDQSSGFATGPTPGFGTLDSGMLKQVHGAVTDDISTAFDQSSPQAQAAYDAASAYYKFYMGETDKKALQSVLRSQTPETIYNGLVKPGMTTGIAMAKKSMSPDVFQQIQDRHMSDFLDTGIDPQTGKPNPLTGAFVRKQIQNWTPATLQAIHGPDMTANILKLPGQLDSLPPSLPENPIFKNIINGPGGPSVISALFKKGGTQNVSDVYNAMDDPGKQLMQQSFLARLLSLDKHEHLSGAAMDSAKNVFGEDMMDLLIPKGQEQPVKDLINTAYSAKQQIAIAQNPPNTAGGFMAAHWFKQLRTNPTEAIIQLMGADGFARVYYSPFMQRAIKEGLVPNGRLWGKGLGDFIGGYYEGGGNGLSKPRKR